MSARVCVTAGLWLCLWILWWDAEENMKTQTICWHLQISGAPGKPLCLSDPDSICHSTALKSPLWELLARSQSSSPFAAGVGMGGHLEPHCSGESLLWGPHDARRWFSPLSDHDSMGWLFVDTDSHVARLTLSGGKWPWPPKPLAFYLLSPGIIGTHHPT